MLTLSELLANTQADATGRLLARGKLCLYPAPRPATADDPPGVDPIAEVGFTAFRPAADGTIRSTALTPDPDAAGEGRIAWFRCVTEAGAAVFDGDVGGPGDKGPDGEPVEVTLGTADVRRGAEVIVDEFTYQTPKE